MNALRELAAKKEAVAAQRHVDDLKRLFFPKLRFKSDPVRSWVIQSIILPIIPPIILHRQSIRGHADMHANDVS